jgi:ferric-dicitrate binding protein FerR (iron transport regulator)
MAKKTTRKSVKKTIDKQKPVKKTVDKPKRTAQKEVKKTPDKPRRKKLLVVVAVIVIVCICGFVWFLLQSQVVQAQLIIESGTVQVKHVGEAWTPAQNGTLLYMSDSVRTGNNTSAFIVFFESSIIRLDSNTEVSLQKILQQEGVTSVEINQKIGRTWNTVLKVSGIDNYEVHTPTTIASVRGTSFFVKVQVDGETEVGVVEGVVNVSSVKDGRVLFTVIVNENESVTVDPERIDQPLETIPLEKDEWVLKNQQKDEGFIKDVKAELYRRIQPYIPILKERFGVTDQELDVLIDGYIRGYFDLPPDTPGWIRDLIELS